MKELFFNLKEIFRRGGVLFFLFLVMLYTCTWWANSIYFCAPFLTLLLASDFNRIGKDNIGKYLFAFSIVFVVLLYITGQVATMFGALGVLCGPTACYLYGKNLVDKHNGNGSILNTILMICVLVFVLRLGLNTLEDIRNGELVNALRVIELDRNLSATLYGLTVSVAMGGIAIIYAMPDRIKSLTAWGYMLAFVLGLLTVIHLVNRSGLFTAVVTFFVILVYLSKLNPSKLILYVFVTIALVFMAVRFGLVSDEVFSAYETRSEYDLAFYEEGNAQFGGRGDRWTVSMGYLFTQPLGWATNTSIRMVYAHNLWLDIARQCGIIPFILFLLATVNIIKIYIRIFRARTKDTFFAVLLAVFISISLGCFVEPVIEGNPFVLYFYTFVWGLTVRYEQLHNANYV